mgnify:CR=1 FL=1
MTDQIAIPARMVEAAARAEYACDMAREESDDFEPFAWEETLTIVRTAYLDRAKAGLTAALATCGVLERWGYLSPWSEVPAAEIDHFGYLPPHPPGRDVETWERSRLIAESLVAQAGRVPRRLIRRLVITTPTEVVPAGKTT